MFKGLKGLKKVLSLVVVLILLVGTSVYAQTEPETYKIGVILPLTGNLAFLGVGQKQGLELAVDHANDTLRMRGKSLKLFFGDSKGSNKEAVTLVNKMIATDDIKIFFVSLTGPVHAVAPIIDRIGGILFAFTLQPGITDISQNIFRVCVSGNQEWNMIADYCKNQSLGNIAMIVEANEYGMAARDIFIKEAQPTCNVLINKEYIQAGKRDFRDLLIPIKNAQEDLGAIILITHAPRLIQIIKQAREMGIQLEFIGNVNFTYEFVRKAISEIALGSIFTTPLFGIVSQKGFQLRFVDAYKAKYGKEPGWNEAYSYDNIIVLSEAIKRARSGKVQDFKQALYEIDNISGATGKISIKRNGDAKTEIHLARLGENGKIEIIKK